MRLWTSTLCCNAVRVVAHVRVQGTCGYTTHIQIHSTQDPGQLWGGSTKTNLGVLSFVIGVALCTGTLLNNIGLVLHNGLLCGPQGRPGSTVSLRFKVRRVIQGDQVDQRVELQFGVFFGHRLWN